MSRDTRRCPCASGRRLKRCCGPYHAGRPAPSPEALMRSRFSAYALGDVDYIVATTDPEGDAFQHPEATWRPQIDAFCRQTRFVRVRILGTGDLPAQGSHPMAFVRFRAELTQGGQDASFEEKSRFRQVDGRWLYRDGLVD